MACGTPLCFFKPVLAVAAIAAVGMGGFNLATSGCLLGSCHAKAGQATTLTSTGDASAPKSGCCSGSQEAEPTAMLANMTADDCQGCPDAMREACEADGGCPAMMSHCESGGECPFSGKTAQTSLVADKAADKDAGECPMQGACDKPCDSQDKADCHQKTEQTAEADTETAAG